MSYPNIQAVLDAVAALEESISKIVLEQSTDSQLQNLDCDLWNAMAVIESHLNSRGLRSCMQEDEAGARSN